MAQPHHGWPLKQNQQALRHQWRWLLLAAVFAFPGPTDAAVYLEDSPAALRLADEAQDLQERDRAGEAAQKLQQIVDEYPDKLMPRDDGGYTDARLWVRQRLLDDTPLREAYHRRFDTTAQRLLDEAEPAGLASEQAAVLEVLERYPLTPAGLDAALRLAGRHIEAGDGPAATAALAEALDHPDLERRAAMVFELRAWAAALSGQPKQAAAALDKRAGYAPVDPTLRNTLAGLADSLPETASNQDAADRPPLARPLWQLTIESTTTARIVAQPRAVQGAADGAVRFDPVAADGVLLINDNKRVYAIDRISGRLRWAHRYDEPLPDNAVARARAFGAGRIIQDRRRVLIHRQSVYAVLGHAVPWQGRQRLQTIRPTQLVSLNLDHGKPRWTVTPGSLDPALERAAFHGTPVAWGDLVIVMARRSQASSFQDTYLFALDAATGELRWRRHLASTAGPNSRNALPAMSSMTLADGRVFICDNLGAAAAVEARTGTVRWVRVLVENAADARGRPAGTALPFSDAASPTLCTAGLIIPMRINDAHGLLLNPDTGNVLRELPARTPLAQAYELHTLPDGDVLTVGKTLARLDGASLDTRWSQSITPPRVEGVSPRVTLHAGRALVARENDQLQEIDLTTGDTLDQTQLPRSGAVLATSDAWVVTSGRRLAGYLDWSVAYDTLRRRAEDQPTSPEPGLNMAMLAVNAAQPDAVDEGVDRALSALRFNAALRESDPDGWRAERSRVFHELLSLAERGEAMQPTVIERLFDRLAATTETPKELLAYNLGRGAFLEAQGRLSEAVDFYQAVLLDPRQADQTLTRGQATRRGDLAARQRLVSLAETHGRDFYERYDRRAEGELSALLGSPSANVADFLGLARRYPLARIAAQAIFAGAELQAGSATHTGAATQYRRAFQLAEDDDLRRRAAGALTHYYMAHGRPAAAVRWLEQVSRDRPGLQPLRDGLPRDATAWLAELRALPQNRRDRPGVDPPFGEPIRLTGQIVPALDEATGVARPGGVLMFPEKRRDQLAFYDLKLRSHRWQVAAPEPGLRLIDQSPDTLILWSGRSGRLHGMDAATGRTLWPAVNAAPLLEDLGVGGLREARAANAGQMMEIIEADFGPINRERLNNPAPDAPPTVLAGEAVVCVVDGKGRAFGLDRTTGQVLWQSALPLDAVTHLRVVDEVLGVAGVVSPDTEAQAGRFLLVDLATGRLRLPAIEELEPATWLGFAPGGDLIVLTKTRATLYDRRDGGARWRLPLGDFVGHPNVVPADDVLFLHGKLRLVAIDLEHGRFHTQGPNLLARSSALGLTFGGNGALFTLAPEASLKLDAELVVRWQDALADEPKRLITQRLGDRHVFVLLQRRVPDTPPTLSVAALDRDSGRLIGVVGLPDLGPVSTVGTLLVLRDHLLIADRQQIVLIPGQPQVP